MPRGANVPKREKDRPISSFEEYLRLYLPDDARELSRAGESPAEIGEEIGREAVKRAVAGLTSSKDQ